MLAPSSAPFGAHLEPVRIISVPTHGALLRSINRRRSRDSADVADKSSVPTLPSRTPLLEAASSIVSHTPSEQDAFTQQPAVQQQAVQQQHWQRHLQPWGPVHNSPRPDVLLTRIHRARTPWGVQQVLQQQGTSITPQLCNAVLWRLVGQGHAEDTRPVPVARLSDFVQHEPEEDLWSAATHQQQQHQHQQEQLYAGPASTVTKQDVVRQVLPLLTARLHEVDASLAVDVITALGMLRPVGCSGAVRMLLQLCVLPGMPDLTLPQLTGLIQGLAHLSCRPDAAWLEAFCAQFAWRLAQAVAADGSKALPCPLRTKAIAAQGQSQLKHAVAAKQAHILTPSSSSSSSPSLLLLPPQPLHQVAHGTLQLEGAGQQGQPHYEQQQQGLQGGLQRPAWRQALPGRSRRPAHAAAHASWLPQQPPPQQQQQQQHHTQQPVQAAQAAWHDSSGRLAARQPRIAAPAEHTVSRQVCACLWALQHLHYPPSPAWLQQVLAHLITPCSTQPPLTLTDLAWLMHTLARLRYKPSQQWLDHVLRVSEEHMHQHVQALQAQVAQDQQEATLLHSQQHQQQHQQEQRGQAQHAASGKALRPLLQLLWGLATLRVSLPSQWLTSCKACVLLHLHQATSTQLATLMQVLSTLQRARPMRKQQQQKREAQRAARSARRARQLHTAAPSTQPKRRKAGTGRAASLLLRTHQEVVVLKGPLHPLYAHRPGRPPRVRLSATWRQEGLSGGDAEAARAHHALLQGVWRQVHHLLPSIPLKDACLMLYATRTLHQARQRRAWVQALVPVISQHHFPSPCTESDLVLAVHTLASLKLRASTGAARQWLLACVKGVRGFSPMQLARVCWGLGRVGARPSEAALLVLCAAVRAMKPRMRPHEARQAALGIRQLVRSLGPHLLSPQGSSAVSITLLQLLTPAGSVQL